MPSVHKCILHVMSMYCAVRTVSDCGDITSIGIDWKDIKQSTCQPKITCVHAFVLISSIGKRHHPSFSLSVKILNTRVILNSNTNKKFFSAKIIKFQSIILKASVTSSIRTFSRRSNRKVNYVIVRIFDLFGCRGDMLGPTRFRRG